jgi:uncharacterized protein with ParB-like and HNH nuclease domain
MSTDNKKLSEIFNGRLFRIPDYQRGYAWEDEHLQAFWDDLDLLSSTPNGAPHYTGLISLEPVDRAKAEQILPTAEHWLLEDCKLCLVVDGQQRLTTLIIFLFELLRQHKTINPNGEVITPTAKRSSVEE